MKKITQSIAIITLISFLSACGGGNNNSSNGAGSNSFSDGDIKTGQFKDSAVKGLVYETATQSGITDEKGTFKYKAGETVTFKIGSMKIGSAEGKSILYPTHITDNKVKAIKIAQVLQTLDKDKDPEKGIDIEGQFVFESTKNKDVQQADLQALIDGIKKTPGLLVDADKAEKHMSETISADAHATFESVSNQTDIDSRISIDNDRLKLSPQTPESVWLLAKNATEITSLSADIEMPDANIASLGLVLELNNGIDKAVYFHIRALNATNFGCPPGAAFCTNEVYEHMVVNSLYSGEFLKDPFSVIAKNAPYIEETLIQNNALGFYYVDKANLTIELSKADKKVIVKYDNKQSYFDIKGLFSDFDQVQAKFFITTLGGFHKINKSVFVNNVKINNQDFDDFSATTLNTNKWKIGKFSYSDAYTTFESVSNQKDIDNRISIDNDHLKLSPQTSESVWLLAKNATEITSLSADIEMPDADIASLGLVLELNNEIDKAVYFHIRAMNTTRPECLPNSEVCTAKIAEHMIVNSLYSGKFLSKDPFSAIGESAPYIEDTLTQDNTLDFYGVDKANLTIELSKTDKSVIVKHNNKQSYFDIKGLFSDFDQVQAKFFIKTLGSFHKSDKSVFVNNVKINNQDFDDFSATTLDTNKWKTGKFSYSGE